MPAGAAPTNSFLKGITMMIEEKKNLAAKKPHSLTLEERSMMRLTGVEDVDSFDEQTIMARTSMGEVTVKGEGLHISSLNVDTGELTLEGRVDAFVYREMQPKGSGVFSKLFR